MIAAGVDSGPTGVITSTATALATMRATMISQQLLDLLRCPLDPAHAARLEPVGEGLACQRCRLEYPIREGIPCMLPEEAKLPSGCPSLDALPCKQPQPGQGAVP